MIINLKRVSARFTALLYSERVPFHSTQGLTGLRPSYEAKKLSRTLILFVFSSCSARLFLLVRLRLRNYTITPSLTGAISSYYKIAGNNDISGYLNLAVIFKDLSHYETGIKILNSARVKFGNDPRLLVFLGRLYYLNGSWILP